MDIQSIILASGTTEPVFNVGIFILMLVLIALSSFFSMSETAFSSVGEAKLRVAVEDRKRGAKKALQLSEKFEKVLITLLIGNNMVNVALSTISVTFFIYLGINEAWVSLISTFVITLVLLIFGEIIPKMIAKQHPESVAISVAYIVYLFSIIFYPLTFSLKLL